MKASAVIKRIETRMNQQVVGWCHLTVSTFTASLFLSFVLFHPSIVYLFDHFIAKSLLISVFVVGRRRKCSGKFRPALKEKAKKKKCRTVYLSLCLENICVSVDVFVRRMLFCCFLGRFLDFAYRAIISIDS